MKKVVIKVTVTAISTRSAIECLGKAIVEFDSNTADLIVEGNDGSLCSLNVSSFEYELADLRKR